MSARLARLALALYPLAWRRRYGAEMAALVEDSGASPRTVANLARGAVRAHLRPEPAVAGALDRDDRLRLSAATVLLCWALFAAAIFGFAKTTEEADFGAAGSAHALLGGAHLALQLLAVLATLAFLVGAVPLVLVALGQARRRPAVRRAAFFAAGCVALTVAATGTVVLIANGHPDAGSGLREGALVIWIGVGIASAIGCALAARRGLFAADVPAGMLRLAGACAAVVAVAMVGIAVATAAYLGALLVDAPSLAGEGNGPGSSLSVGASVAICVAAMALTAAVGVVSAARSRRAILD